MTGADLQEHGEVLQEHCEEHQEQHRARAARAQQPQLRPPERSDPRRVNLRPPSPRAVRAAGALTCCQQRECTVGTWVGATVGRGGGKVAARAMCVPTTPSTAMPRRERRHCAAGARGAGRGAPLTSRRTSGGGPARRLRSGPPTWRRCSVHLVRGEGRGVSNSYGVRDAACPLSTREGGGGSVLV